MSRYDARIKQMARKVVEDAGASFIIAGTSVPCIVSDQAYTENLQDAGSQIIRRLEADFIQTDLSGLTIDIGTLGTHGGNVYRIHEPKTVHSNGNLIRIVWGAE